MRLQLEASLEDEPRTVPSKVGPIKASSRGSRKLETTMQTELVLRGFSSSSSLYVFMCFIHSF